ncbi:MAG: preprotein translocase subunit SecE [Alphaproteobacteria bacterium]|nr:preprotein translocase subunit SecE [Alphaproteobacteria bacterium]
MAKTGPVEYLHQVRNEMKKVTWPSRKETTVSTIAVFIMVTIAAIFLFFADQVMAFVVRLLLGIGN